LNQRGVFEPHGRRGYHDQFAARDGYLPDLLKSEESIRTKGRIIVAARHPRYSSITPIFSLVLLFAGFHDAGAETPKQPGTNSTMTDSEQVSAETATWQNPSSPAAQQEPATGPAPPVFQVMPGVPQEATRVHAVVGKHSIMSTKVSFFSARRI